MKSLAETTRFETSIAGRDRFRLLARTDEPVYREVSDLATTAIRRWVTVGILLLAGALLLLLVVRPRDREAEAGVPDFEQLIASAHEGDALEEGWLDHGWAVTRGAPPGNADVPFRMGVLVADLRIALDHQRRADAALVTRRLETLLEVVSFPEPLRAALLDLRRAIEGGQEERQLQGLADLLEAQIVMHPDIERDGYTFGKWCEVGRLSAKRESESLREDPEFRNFLGRASRKPRSPEVSRELETIETLLDRVNGGPSAELVRAFTAIIDQS